MDNTNTGQAIGIFEMDGFMACLVALDAAAKVFDGGILSTESRHCHPRQMADIVP